MGTPSPPAMEHHDSWEGTRLTLHTHSVPRSHLSGSFHSARSVRVCAPSVLLIFCFKVTKKLLPLLAFFAPTLPARPLPCAAFPLGESLAGEAQNTQTAWGLGLMSLSDVS